MPNFEVEFLINLIQSLEADPLSQMRVFFGPVLEDELKVGTNSCSLILQLFDVILLIEEKLDGVGGNHQVKYQVAIFSLITSDTDNIANLL